MASELPPTEWLGKEVEVTLSEHSVPKAIARGKLMHFDDGGGITLIDEMGFVHHCWPMLDVRLVEELPPKRSLGKVKLAGTLATDDGFTGPANVTIEFFNDGTIVTHGISYSLTERTHQGESQTQ